MKKYLYTKISFQVMIAIGFGLTLTALIQYIYSERIIEESILNGSKQQAYTYLLGIERQIQNLNDPFNKNQLSQIFRDARFQEINNLSFSIINIYMYDRLGKVVAYLHKPNIISKDLSSYYGKVLQTDTPYLGETIEKDYFDEKGNAIQTTDILTSIHYDGKTIGGLEVEIDLDKTFALIKQLDNRYEFQISAMLCTIILLLLIFIWSIMNFQLMSPVKKINRVTKQIADGNLKARVEIKSMNEIGQLGQSVNKMAESLEQLFGELDETYMGTLNALTNALEAKDNYTVNHSKNVTDYSLELGNHLGLNDEQLEVLKQGAMLHDIGKIGIPDDILNKTAKLNDIERNIIQQHPPLTSSILEPLEKFKHFSAIARHHHERWDGKGYPDGLRGKHIPLLARIVAITDSWDAMTSDRVYRKAMKKEEAIQILEQEKNSGQWDPYLVDQFIILLRNKDNYELPVIDIAA